MKQPIDDYDLMDLDWDEFIRRGQAELECESRQERMMDVWDKENMNRFSQKNCPSEWKQPE